MKRMSSQPQSADENSPPETFPDTPPKKKRKIVQKHRAQKFKDDWLKDNKYKMWLAKVPDNPFRAKCLMCNATFTAELTVIKKHMESQNHQCHSLKHQPKINSFLNTRETKMTSEASHRFEIKMCAFLVDHNIPFRVLDHLTPLIKECVPDSAIMKGVQLKSSKGAAIVKNVIGESEKETLQTKLKSTCFSILIDECTDIAAVKTMCIIVRYFDVDEGHVVSKFWDLCQVFTKDTDAESATAKHLFGLLTTSLKSHNIPTANIIGFGSDGCNTIMGKENSAASRFREECPGIYISKCICHSLHLCSNKACKELPRSCETLARNVYNEFKNSSKRQHQFEKFQNFLDIEVHKILRPSQTRWLSLHAVVERILEQWDALKYYFQAQMLTARLREVDQIIQALNDPLIKLFYLFLAWVLPKFTKLNELFQSASVVLTSLWDKMRIGYQELLESYLRKSYIHQTNLKDIDPCNKANRLPFDQMYLGVKVMDMLSKPEIHSNEQLKLDFRTACVNFLEVGCQEIKKRFDFNYPVLKLVSNLSPAKSMSRKTRQSVPSLLPLMKAVPRIVSPEQYQDIDDEWRQLPFFELPGHINLNDDVDIFWAKLLMCDQGDQGLTFKNLAKFVLGVISLPHANADCERLFSKVNLIKTKTRNKLVTKTVNGILLAKQRVKGNCVSFEPSKQEYSRMTAAQLYPKKRVSECTNKTIRDLYTEGGEDSDMDDDIVMPSDF